MNFNFENENDWGALNRMDSVPPEVSWNPEKSWNQLEKSLDKSKPVNKNKVIALLAVATPFIWQAAMFLLTLQTPSFNDRLDVDDSSNPSLTSVFNNKGNLNVSESNTFAVQNPLPYNSTSNSTSTLDPLLVTNNQSQRASLSIKNNSNDGKLLMNVTGPKEATKFEKLNVINEIEKPLEKSLQDELLDSFLPLKPMQEHNRKGSSAIIGQLGIIHISNLGSGVQLELSKEFKIVDHHNPIFLQVGLESGIFRNQNAIKEGEQKNLSIAKQYTLPVFATVAIKKKLGVNSIGLKAGVGIQNQQPKLRSGLVAELAKGRVVVNPHVTIVPDSGDVNAGLTLAYNFVDRRNHKML